jgi:hypothetical protein
MTTSPLRFAELAILMVAASATSAIGQNLPYSPFDPPGSYRTSPTAINNAGVIVGTYNTSSTATTSHSFIRDALGNINTYDVPTGVSTSLMAINGFGTSAGFYSTADNVQHGFILTSSGQVTAVDVANSTGTSLAHINDNGVTAGGYSDANGTHEFVRDAQGNITPFTIAGSTSMSLTGLNNSNVVVGSYSTSPTFANYHGYIRDAQGNITSFDPVGSVSTFVTALNNSGSVAGNFLNASGNDVGFIRDSSGNTTFITNPFSSLNPSSLNNVFISSINNSGAVSGELFARFMYVGFIRDSSGQFEYFNPQHPASIAAINDSGVGAADFFRDTTDTTLSGAIVNASGVPEPSSLVLCGTAALMGLFYRWRRKRSGIN